MFRGQVVVIEYGYTDWSETEIDYTVFTDDLDRFILEVYDLTTLSLIAYNENDFRVDITYKTPHKGAKKHEMLWLDLKRRLTKKARNSSKI